MHEKVVVYGRKSGYYFTFFGLENKDGDVFGGQRTHHDIARTKTHLEIEALSRKRQWFGRDSGWRVCVRRGAAKRSCGSERAAWANENMAHNAFTRSCCRYGGSVRRKLGS